MKTIILKSLTMTNFKGEQSRTTHFNEKETTISGGNGQGKSRHFDAFLWLLFGKDTKDRKDYEIRTRINGEELHKVECSVDGEILVNGEQLTIKRELKENWVKPRGQAEEVLKGNVTNCWWNNTPISVTEYNKRISEIIDINVFKMVTNPEYFTSLDWKTQRQQLFNIAGNISDREIAKDNSDYLLLLDKLSNKSLDDYKREISATKSRLKTKLSEIQPRIEQTKKMMPEEVDYVAIDAEIAEKNKAIAELEDQRKDVLSIINTKVASEEAKIQKINQLKTALNDLVYNAEQEAIKEYREKNAEKDQLYIELNALKDGIADNTDKLNKARVSVAFKNQEIEKLEKEQADLRARWFEWNEKQYDGTNVCIHCGQTLPDNLIADAKKIFNEKKKSQCEEIASAGKELGDKIDSIKNDIKVVDNGKIELLEEQIKQDKEKARQITEQIKALPLIEKRKIVPEETDGYLAIDAKIKKMAESIGESNGAETSTSEIDEQIKTLRSEIENLKISLSSKDAIDKCNAEVEELEKLGKDLAQQIADVERSEYTIQEFTKAKIEEVEKRIAGAFKLVSFRLYEYTLDGNPVEVCIPMIDGVYHSSANTAKQVNAGIDIINTLSNYYQVSAPIFIDGRERINEIIPTDSQLVNLLVTNDNKITIK